jgi:hypothetical protein
MKRIWSVNRTSERKSDLSRFLGLSGFFGSDQKCAHPTRWQPGARGNECNLFMTDKLQT